ncbi:MAG: MFS transporter [Deltaproteobacteria bacterium]|nr:MFS transporter [Deltaproteobacteria bacterium]
MSELTAPKVRRTLTWSLVDGACYAVMVGVCESYLSVLAVELGHRDTALALLVTVPMLCGALVQLLTGPLVGWLGQGRRLVVVGAALQAICHLGFLWIALDDERRLWPLLVVKTLFAASGAVIVPAWNAWMTNLTEGIDRERYFARRSGLVYAVLLASYLLGGVLLDRGRVRGELLGAFALLFAVGLLARVLSAGALAMQRDDGGGRGGVRPLQRLRDALARSRWQVALFTGAVMLGAYVSVPFFAPYMLLELKLDYCDYALLTSVSLLAKSVAFPLFHRVGNRFGLRPTLAGAGLGVALVPFCWWLFPSYSVLLLVEIGSGIAWAGFEFASFQLLIQSAASGGSVEFFSLSNALSGVLQLAGSLLGSFALAHFALAYREIFFGSSLLRALPLLILLWPPALAGARRPLPRLFLRISSAPSARDLAHRPILHQQPGPERTP